MRIRKLTIENTENTDKHRWRKNLKGSIKTTEGTENTEENKEIKKRKPKITQRIIIEKKSRIKTIEDAEI